MTQPILKALSRRRILLAAGALPMASVLTATKAFCAEGTQGSAFPSDIASWQSADVSQAFAQFADTRRMPPELDRWLNDPAIQSIDPYRVFDNVWNVGIRWVSAFAVKTTDGWALIDTLHEPFVDRLFENLRTVGVPLDEIRYVFMTHGHFDHVGGYYRLRPALKNARFVMSETGWTEARESARASKQRAKPWIMDEHVDIVAKDGDRFALGDNIFTLLETPGHTWGTASYCYQAQRGAKRYTAVTIGGQGLNAIEGPKQLDAYIASMKRLADPALGIEVDMTAHPFTTGLTERIDAITHLKPQDAHPLVNRAEYLERLEQLIKGAEARRRTA